MTRPRQLRALLELARAELALRSVRVRFLDTERSIRTRTVDVLALAFEPGPPRWVVATWARETGSLRLLELDRVLGVSPTRRHAGPPPGAFDPLWFSVRSYLDPGAATAPATVRLDRPWAGVARALLPTSAAEPLPSGGARVAVRASRPEVVGALAASLAPGVALDSRSRPWPRPPRSTSRTRPASSASPPGSSRSPPRSPAPRSTPGSPTTGARRLTRRRCSPATRTR